MKTSIKKKHLGMEMLAVSLIIIPIGTLINSIPFIGEYINKFLIFFVLSGLFLILFDKASVTTYLLTVGVIMLTIIDIILTKLPFVHVNEVFYLSIWVIYLNVFYDRGNEIFNVFEKYKKPIIYTIILWNFIVLISLFDVNGYHNGFFVSYTGGQHRLCSSALQIIAYVLFLHARLKDNRLYIFLIVPYITIIISGARTYLGLSLVLFLFIIYKFFKNKILFFTSIIPLSVFLFIIVINTSIFQQRLELDGYMVQEYGELAAFTSGRNVFWTIDMQHIMLSNNINKIFGNGFNFIQDVNRIYYGAQIWAHNDYINILGCNGYIGLFLYFVSYFRIFKYRKKLSKRNSFFALIILHFILIFNAFFNMLYTYLSAMLATPFLVYVFFEKQKNLQKRN